VTRALQNAEITSISSVVSGRDTLTRDYTFFVGGLIPQFASFPSPDREGATNDTSSEELRIASLDVAGPLQYVGGLYFRRQSTHTFQDVHTFGAGVTEPGIPSDLVYEDLYHFSVRQFAGFGEVSLALSSWTFIVGARAYQFHIASSKTGDGLFNGGPVANITEGSNTGVIPKLEATFHITSDKLLYALGNKGFDREGPTPQGRYPPLAVLI
jgi:iron complex outermembrane recepter protein